MRVFPSFGIALALGALGCSIDDIPFRCGKDAQCVDRGTQGQCEVTGYCSFRDATCGDNGRRYGSEAPANLADQCVPKCVGKLALGGFHSCALRYDGRVFCWGDAVNGQVGTGPSSEANVPRPFEVTAVDTATDVAAGILHSCAVNKSSGNVWCWGSNLLLQLGSLTRTDVGPLEILTNNHLPDQPSVEVTAGKGHSCARGAYGVECWGDDLDGQLGTPDLIAESAIPRKVSAQGFNIPSTATQKIDAGDNHTCAKLPSQDLWCWGDNENGQLAEPAGNPAKERTPIKSSGGVSDFALGANFTCVIAGQNVKCWGVDIGKPSNDVALDGAASKLCAGAGYACAVLSDGRAECWGANGKGQMGPDAKGSPSAPVIIPIDAKVTEISCGAQHICAITETDRVYCWGDNVYGQLGNGQSGDASGHPDPDRSVTQALCAGL